MADLMRPLSPPAAPRAARTRILAAAAGVALALALLGAAATTAPSASAGGTPEPVTRNP
jgi:hypothetical protein